MGCKPSKPKGGRKGHAARPVQNIHNGPQVSHRPQQQQQGHYPSQQPPPQRFKPVRQPHPYESSDDEEYEPYNPPVASHQQQTQHQQQKQQQQKPYANDPRYQKGQDAAQALAKLGTECLLPFYSPLPST
jgi:hypothetical protein